MISRAWAPMSRFYAWDSLGAAPFVFKGANFRVPRARQQRKTIRADTKRPRMILLQAQQKYLDLTPVE